MWPREGGQASTTAQQLPSQRLAPDCPVGIPTAFKGHCGACTGRAFHLVGGQLGAG